MLDPLELHTLRGAAGWSRQQIVDRLHYAVSPMPHLEFIHNLPKAAELEKPLRLSRAEQRTEVFRNALETTMPDVSRPLWHQ